MRFAFRMAFAAFGLALSAVPASAACLSRDIVAENGKSETITVLVADDEAARLEAKGFAVSGCPVDSLSQTHYRDEICRVASEGNSAVQLRLADVLGESPEWLCASAKRLLPSGEQDTPSSDDNGRPPTPPEPAPDEHDEAAAPPQ